MGYRGGRSILGGATVLAAVAACAGPRGEGARAPAPALPGRISRAPGAAAASSPGPDPCDVEAGGTLGLPRCPNTGDPLPAEPQRDPRCEDGAPDASRWLASDPHTPFAVSASGSVGSAGQPCCAPWARFRDRYRALDRWGQVVGLAEVAGGEGYDVTACFELELRVTSGSEGVGVYVSDRGAWQPGPSAEWRPDDATAAELAAFVDTVETLVSAPGLAPPGGAPLAPLEARTLFFQASSETDAGAAVDHYAVVGGRFLVVAWRAPEGRWVLTHLDVELTNLDGAPNDAYRPLAAVDMDGDRVPELVVHWTDGPSWGDRALRREDRRGPWVVVATSVGGATL